MTAASTARRLPGRFAAMVAYAVRVCVPARRRAVLAVPGVVAVLFGLLTRAIEDEPVAEVFAAVTSGGLFGLVLPLACLVVGDGVLGADVRAGTFALTWLSPAPFSTIAVARWLGGWLVALAALVPAMALAALVAGVPDAVVPLLVAIVPATAAYIGLFVFIGAATRRAALWSLGVVLLGERLLGTALAGIAQISPYWLARNVYADVGPDAGDFVRGGMPGGAGAVARLALLTAVTVALASWRVRHLRLSGKED